MPSSTAPATTLPAEGQARSAASAGASRLGQWSWALFEFGRSPYLTLVYVYVFAPYFAATVVGDALRGQELWSFANTLTGVFVALLAPVLGAVCDRMGGRKPWLLALVGIMAPCCVVLWWAMPGAQGGLPIPAILAVIVVLATCFQFTDMFHSAMLPTLAPPDRVGGLSGLGIAVGNAGSMVVLTAVLFTIALPASGTVDWPFLPEAPLFGLDPADHEHSRIGGPIAAAWMVVFVIPMMLWTPDRPSTGVRAREAVRQGLAQLWLTVKCARRYTNVGLYLLARTLYTDAKVAIIAYAGIYAAGIFAWDMGELLIFGLVLTPFAVLGGLAGGWIDNRFGSKRAIQVSVGATLLGLIAAVSISRESILFMPASAEPVWSSPYFSTLPQLVYLGLFMLLAAAVTAAFANSRAMMARIAPVSMMSQFFGLYGLAGTATSFLGHGLVAVFTRIFQSQRAGLASLAILLILGLAFLHRVREERAMDIVEA